MTKTLSATVLERFMAPDEFKKFIETYRANSHCGRNRLEGYKKLVSKEDKELLRKFMTIEKSAMKVEKELKCAPGTLELHLKTICLKLVYQNMEKLGI